MSSDEKRAWIMVVVSLGSYATYAAVILCRAGEHLADAPYVRTLISAVVISVIASIVLNIVVAILSPKTAGRRDQRDREINRFGEYIGQSFLVVGAVTALGMALARLPYFWIANTIYLAFVLSAALASIAKIVAYRRGFQTW